MDLHPTKLERGAPGELEIFWSDGSQRRYALRDFLDQCPCATCREKRDQPPVEASPLAIVPNEELEPLSLVEMRPVGSYAYSVILSHGCQSGIFTFERLLQMGTPLGDDS